MRNQRGAPVAGAAASETYATGMTEPLWGRVKMQSPTYVTKSVEGRIKGVGRTHRGGDLKLDRRYTIPTVNVRNARTAASYRPVDSAFKPVPLEPAAAAANNEKGGSAPKPVRPQIRSRRQSVMRTS